MIQNSRKNEANCKQSLHDFDYLHKFNLTETTSTAAMARNAAAGTEGLLIRTWDCWNDGSRQCIVCFFGSQRILLSSKGEIIPKQRVLILQDKARSKTKDFSLIFGRQFSAGAMIKHFRFWWTSFLSYQKRIGNTALETTSIIQWILNFLFHEKLEFWKVGRDVIL